MSIEAVPLIAAIGAGGYRAYGGQHLDRHGHRCRQVVPPARRRLMASKEVCEMRLVMATGGKLKPGRSRILDIRSRKVVYRHLDARRRRVGGRRRGARRSRTSGYSARWLDLVVSAHRRNDSVRDFLEDRLFPALLAPGLRPVQHELVGAGLSQPSDHVGEVAG